MTEGEQKAQRSQKTKRGSIILKSSIHIHIDSSQMTFTFFKGWG